MTMQPGDKVIPNFVATVHGIHDHDKHGKVVQTVDGNMFRLDELVTVEGQAIELFGIFDLDGKLRDVCRDRETASIRSGSHWHVRPMLAYVLKEGT
jgi:hypothetical protein